MLTLIVDTARSLKEFTDDHYAQASFYWSYLLKNREIKVNGKKVGENVPLIAGDVVSYYLTEKQAAKPAYHTVYEDKNVVIIDKENGVNAEAVFAALCRVYGENCCFIHRLDRNTRGLMVFALNEAAEDTLLTAFKERTVEKKYHALCFGKFSKETAILTAYLQKDEKLSLVSVYDSFRPNSEKIVTEYRVLETYKDTTKIEVTLHTGKTHQIRAHLAHISCPVVGDMKYGDSAKNRAKNVTRQCLVAKELAFTLGGDMAYLNGKRFISRFNVERSD